MGFWLFILPPFGMNIKSLQSIFGRMKPIGCDGFGRPRRLMQGCSEQGKLPSAEAFKLAERDNHMSEEKQSFMQALDLWSDANVVLPLASEDPKHEDWQTVVEQVKQAIRQKVLESYRNGQQATAKVAGKGGSHGR